MFRLLILVSALFSPILTCPDGSIQGLDNDTCYRFVSQQLSWYSAEMTCVTYGGHLTSISSALENKFLNGQARNEFGGANDFWIGSNNILLTFNWTWADVTNFGYTNWAKGEPNQNTTNRFYCLKQDLSSGTWSPEFCSSNKSFVCKVPKNGPPCEANWTYYNATNLCYQLVQNSTNFTYARSQCESQGGNLASIHNSLQGAAISSFAMLHSKYEVWVGLYFPMANNWWGWTDGSRLDYLNWALGQPTNLRGYQCVKIETANNWTHPWTADLCDNWGSYPLAVCVKNPKIEI